MVSIDTNVPSYFNICLVVIGIAFWILLVYSTLKLLSNCLTYGRQRGIVAALTPIYWITLLTNAAMVLLIVLHEIKIHQPFVRNDNIENIVRLLGSYVVLWLNFTIDCLILSCWLALFADLFGFASKLCVRKHGLKKFIYALLILSAVYLLIVIVVSVLIEIADISVINLQILSYVHCAPIALNIIVSLLCICKLPIAQPLDLSIGLYQRNTKCSCYTRVTRYVWSISMIGIAQIFYLILYILEIDIWSIDQNKNDKYMNIVTNNMALLIYFVSQFVVLLLLWGFLYISIKQSFDFYTILDVIKAVIPSTISQEIKQNENAEIQIEELQTSKKKKGHPMNMIPVPQQSPHPVTEDEDYDEAPDADDPDREPIIEHNKQLTEEQITHLIAAQDPDDYDPYDPNNYQKVSAIVDENEESKEAQVVEMEEYEEKAAAEPIPKPIMAESVYSTQTRIKDDDAKMDIAPLISTKGAESESPTPTPIGEESDSETEGKSIDDEKAPPPPIPPVPRQSESNMNIENPTETPEAAPDTDPDPETKDSDDNENDNDNDNETETENKSENANNAEIPQHHEMETMVVNKDYVNNEEVEVEVKEKEEEEAESSDEEEEGTEVRHDSFDAESDEEEDDESNPNIIVKF